MVTSKTIKKQLRMKSEIQKQVNKEIVWNLVIIGICAFVAGFAVGAVI